MNFKKHGKWVGILAVLVILGVGAFCLTDAKKSPNDETIVSQSKAETTTKQGEEETTIGNLDYTTKEYKKNEIDILYPEILNLDSSISDSVNQKIKEEALKLINLDDKEYNKNLSFGLSYYLEFVNHHILSIRFEGSMYEKAAAHPYNMFYTLNIDTNTGKEIQLNDVITVNENMVEAFKTHAGYIGPVSTIEGTEELMKNELRNYNSDEMLNELLLDEETLREEELYPLEPYFTENTFGISFSVPYALGEYANYEMKYSDLEAILKEKGKSEISAYKDVLQNKEQFVYGNIFPYRGMETPKSDGTFIASGGAGNNYIEKILFNKEKIAVYELCAMDAQENKTLWRVNGKEATEEEGRIYFDKQEQKESALWYPYNTEIQS